MERVTVAVPSRTYDVTVASGILDEAGAHLPELAGVERAFVVADTNVAERYLEILAPGWDSRPPEPCRSQRSARLQARPASSPAPGDVPFR